ncbi:MAG: CRISPR-associated protein Cmr3 [Sphingobacteriia bacterium]|nr:CRISPR-associated protein Cmr3 [Sphingobacteriia bacterium]
MSKPSKKGKVRYDKQQKIKEQAQASSGQRDAANPKSGVSLQRQSAKPADPSPVLSLEPLAPLIVRSGRPFDDQAGADAARFPPPSTLAGCLRTAWARAGGRDFGPELANLAVAGPLLARPDADGRLRLLTPKPADAHYFGQGDEARCVRAEPMPFDAGCDADLPDGLSPLRLTKAETEKASRGPVWWDWEDLLAFRIGAMPHFADLERRGWSPPQGDRRTHVAIDPKTLAADAGRLFQTEGMDLESDNPWMRAPTTPSLRLLARCAEALPEGLVHLGGERRLARLRPEAETTWPRPPANWMEDIRKARGLTLTLLTPACFSAGYRPGWIAEDLTGNIPAAPGIRVKLRAVAVERWQPHSGWDLVAKQPRPTRKLVAAGATYWFSLLDAPTPEALALLWLTSLCDLDQDRRDGYGLALPAPWAPTD